MILCRKKWNPGLNPESLRLRLRSDDIVADAKQAGQTNEALERAFDENMASFAAMRMKKMGLMSSNQIFSRH